MTCKGQHYKAPPNTGALFPICHACGNFKPTATEKPPQSDQGREMIDPLDEAAALTAQLTEAYVRHHQDRPRVVPRARCRVCECSIPSGRQAIGADTCIDCQRAVERKR